MNLAQQHCSTDQGHRALSQEETALALSALADWSISGITLVKEYTFLNYYQTLAFVNALAWIAHTEDHHPELWVRYNRVRVEWSTHDTGSLTLNDFICAAKCEALRQQND